MNRVYRSMAVAAGVALLVAGPALAGPKEREQRHRVAQEKIRTLRLMKLVEVLDLDEKTGIKVARVLKQTDEERKTLHGKAQDRMRALEAAAAANKPRNKELTRLVDELLSIRRELHQVEEKEFKELRKVFTPLQQGRYVLVMHQFREKVQRLLHREGRRHRRGPGGPPGAGPGPGPGPGFDE